MFIYSRLCRNLALLCCAILPNSLMANSPTSADDFYDGPYVFQQKSDQSKQVNWICQGKLKQHNVTEMKLSRPSDCGQLPQPTLNPDATKLSADSYQGVKRIVALSDVHGQYDVLIQLLQRHKIIDSELNWAFGNGHMVMTGDMFDRGHQINEVLWFMYKLDAQASQAGGKLHLLMGNHEQMVFRGDLRYVHPRYELSSELLDRPYDELYGKDSEIGQWLRSKNTLVKINDTLFLHGGVDIEWVNRKLALDKVNQLYRTNVDKTKAELKQDPLLSYLFFGNGPTWFRGYFDDNYSQTELDTILAYFDVKRIAVGHTSQDRVLGRFDNKVIAIDSSIKKGKSGELLFIDNQLWRGTYNGKKLPL
ncbi:metallophosphoesterase [Shewanella waksmanii]|uniref:metallophosphoesterase n=1 Tax=Shewanella waksmanii TaxID=213783 RepID=UPI0037369553